MLNSNMPVLQKSGAGLIHNFTLNRGTLFEISYFLYLKKINNIHSDYFNMLFLF